MCECASMRPGSSVIPGKSIVAAPDGTRTSDADPAAAILSPVTTTTHPACVSLPSNTRSARRTTLSAASAATAKKRTAANARNRRISADYLAPPPIAAAWPPHSRLRGRCYATRRVNRVLLAHFRQPGEDECTARHHEVANGDIEVLSAGDERQRDEREP